MSTYDNILEGKYDNHIEIVNSESRKAYRLENQRLLNLFKSDLFEEFQVSGRNAEAAFNLAWEECHASGYADVYCEFETLIL